MKREMALFIASISLWFVFVSSAPSLGAENLWDLQYQRGSVSSPEKASGGPQVSLFVIAFYVVYLSVIWAFNVAMLRSLYQLSQDRRKAAGRIAVANVLLASGDTAMFIAWAVIYFMNVPANELLAPSTTFPLVILGVFSTSLTMSCYYLFIGLYHKDRFTGGQQTIFMSLIIAFFIARLLLHYNPKNVWLSMLLPPGTPNESAWLRNIPLFIYGLLAVILVLIAALKSLRGQVDNVPKKAYVYIIAAMLALILSFVCYGLDVFFSHVVPPSWIWITYTVKTIAYVVALICLWYAEFYLPRRGTSIAVA